MQVGADLFLTSAPIYRVASSIVRLTDWGGTYSSFVLRTDLGVNRTTLLKLPLGKLVQDTPLRPIIIPRIPINHPARFL